MKSLINIEDPLSKQELVQNIESLRMLLIRLGKELGLSNQKTIEISQILDFYLLQYQSDI